MITSLWPRFCPTLYNSSYSCAAVNKISTDSASRDPSAVAELLVLATVYAGW